MKEIHLLEKTTIDQIAAGEVVERPASIAKELVENAVDAGSTAVTVEIKDGGITMLRVTDNGEGIDASQIRTAFLRHATSKLTVIDDLESITSHGFRGEALSSISAIAMVELITKTRGSLTGVRFCIEGGTEKSFEEIGAPEGTTFIVRNVFYNTPARKKFLKSAITEAGYISDLMARMALSHPDIAFQLISNGQTKLHTSGNGKLRDIIYGIYGREINQSMLEIDAVSEDGSMTLKGMIGKPAVSRGSRAFETFFVNNRYVRNNIMTKALEEAFQGLLMQHRFPFAVLLLEINGSMVDVNVHPAKMEVRFSDGQSVYRFITNTAKNALIGREMIIKTVPSAEKEERQIRKVQQVEEKKAMQQTSHPEPFENIRKAILAQGDSPYQPKFAQKEHRSSELAPSLKPRESVEHHLQKQPADILREDNAVYTSGSNGQKLSENALLQEVKKEGQTDHIETETPHTYGNSLQEKQSDQSDIHEDAQINVQAKAQQMSFFDDRTFLKKDHVREHHIVGQIFDTYWIVSYRDSMYIIDQHAAHEKVMYEKLKKRFTEHTFTSQQICPAILVSLTLSEEELLRKHMDTFTQFGFEIDHFGGKEYQIAAAPDNVLGVGDKDLFIQLLDSLSEMTGKPDLEIFYEKLATMACKSAVKGNNRMSMQEADALIGELLDLENPYQCPHGRPTIISMKKYDLDKKFRRIL